jgi:glycosyl transferase, family 25
MINVISLKNSTRRNKFLNSDIEIFDAIEDDLSAIFDKDTFRLIYGRDARKGEIGCTLSHYYLALNHAVNTKDEWSLILEDDAVFDDELFEFKNNCNTISSPTILVLGHSKTKKRNLFIQRLIQPLTNLITIRGFEFGTANVNYCGTVAYMSNKAASKILSAQKLMFWLADDWNIIKNMGINILHIKKPLVYEDFDGLSSTGNKVVVEHDVLRKPAQILYLIILNQIKRIFTK